MFRLRLNMSARGSEEISLILILSLSKGKDPLSRVIQSEAMNPVEESTDCVHGMFRLRLNMTQFTLVAPYRGDVTK